MRVYKSAEIESRKCLMKTRIGIGREPGRSRADRSDLSARRGRFSPNFFLERPAGTAGRSRFGGRPRVERHLHGLRSVLTVCLAAFVLFGTAASASGAPGKSRGSAKKSRESSSASNTKSSSRSSDRSATTTTTSAKQDYKSKQRPDDPPAESGRPPRMKPIRPEPRPDKEKRPRPEPGDPPPGDRRPPPPPPLPPPVIIIDPWPDPYPIIIEERTYFDYAPEPPPDNAETASMLLTGATLVWNGVYIQAGQPNEFVATAGFITGVTSLAMAFRSGSERSITHFLLGTAQIVFSVANLAGGLERNDYYPDYNSDYAPPSTNVNLINYSLSF